MTLAIAAAFAGLLPLAAHGADQDDAASTPTTLGSIVVTATRREEVLQKVPSAVTAISGDEVQNGELRSTKDVARFVPGTQGWNTESRARPRFFIRGVGSNEATNNVVNPIAIYTDQVYYGNSLFLGSPLFDLKRVEVLRGPQGTLWGKNTTGGAFHFISQQVRGRQLRHPHRRRRDRRRTQGRCARRPRRRAFRKTRWPRDQHHDRQ